MTKAPFHTICNDQVIVLTHYLQNHGPFPLHRSPSPIYADALAELRAGQKRSHFMWFVFPQLRGLGRSEMAHRYGLADADEAKAYLAHPILGSRLRECVAALLTHPDKSARAIMGPPDDLKLHSSLTLFNAVAAAGDSVWLDALNQFFGGQLDDATLRLLVDLESQRR